MSEQVNYRIYPSLLDSYRNYLDSEDTYLKYWGNSNNPTKTLEEFEVEQFNKLIDKINRVPVKWEDSEKMDQGTAFGEIVDCLIANKKSDEMTIYSDKEKGVIHADFNKRSFSFPIHYCKEFSDYFKGAESQVRVSAILPTCYGNVEVYGIIDELMPNCVHDIKTTGSYDAWKYRNYAQRLVYPYCLNENGCNVEQFEFNILVIDKSGYKSLTEHYIYDHDIDSEILRERVEEFIGFIETHKTLITNIKLFGEI